MSSRLRAFALTFFAAGFAVSAAHAAPSTELAKLCDDYWQGYLRANPVFATSIGDGRYDDRLEDITPAGRHHEDSWLQSVLVRAQAIDPKPLSPADQVTRSALIEELQDDLAQSSCRLEEWVVSSGVRWGLDATHRAPFQLDQLEANTWRTGLDRIFSTSASIASRAAVNLSASTTALMPSKPALPGL